MITKEELRDIYLNALVPGKTLLSDAKFKRLLYEKNWNNLSNIK